LEKSKIRLKIDYMNKISFLLFALLIAGCSKDYNNVVNVSVTNFQVLAVGTVNSFNYTPTDSILTLKIKFSSTEGVKSVYCDINTPDDKPLNNGHIELLDNGDNSANRDSVSGDNIFSNKFTMSSTFLNGNYGINYYITSNDGSEKLVAQQIIKYDNGQSNIAPVISDIIVDPDTITVTDTVAILTSVKAIDKNGQDDIEKVYFIVYKPDGTTNNFQIEMFDDGNVLTNGDQTAGDGIYSRIIQVDQNNAKGTYTFKFRAKDRGAKFSNEISKEVVIQ